MTLRNQVLVWVGFFLVSILVLWVFRSILLPFVVGLALAYLLNPLVSFLQRLHIGRAFASAIVLLFVVALIFGLFLMLVPLVAQQAIGLAARVPGYVTDLQALAQTLAPQLAEWLGPENAAQLEASLTDLIGRAVAFAGELTAQVAQSGITVLNTIAILFITPVVAFYLLLDWEGMVKRVDDLLPRAYAGEIRDVLNQIDKSMAGVIRGQGSVIVVLSVYYATALSLVGLDFGLAVGLIGGLLSFIPYVGFLVGFTLAMTISLVQFWPDQWLFVVIVLAIYMVGQFLEANVLYPKLVGQSININPVWLMFALFAFALLFGFVGLLLAVPLAAITGVLTRYALGKYQASSLYRDPVVAADGPAAEVPAKPAAAPKRPARRTTQTK
jgi:predicted PurR-regulated permease PerM